MQDPSDEGQAAAEQPRKWAAVGDGISAGSASPYRESSASPPPRRSKARSTSAPHGPSDVENRRDMFDTQRPNVGRTQLWTEDAASLTKLNFVDPSNIASIQAQRSRAQALQLRPRKSFPSNQQGSRPNPQSPQNQNSAIIGRNASLQSLHTPLKDDNYDIIMQPETRPISHEQLAAEVKGIYAGLVMVEARCIDVDNKQATLAQADPSAQPKLNNEQRQALIALHRTLIHEHHDFFLASQHPSASPALRRLASKYAMPARMWRHGIHSFLELLRHRLPASLDHMLAFIYLAYSMMALLYETVPAFETTWIECLGDLGRYRMAIEDDDVRDREAWTGVARYWYSKASDKAPTTGRLYHHLAILARPFTLQQELFYYVKSLCVEIPFTSARESILTLFEPVLKSDNALGQYRLPPLDTAFVKAYGLLFTNRDIEKFDLTIKEFLDVLGNQVGRITRKFMEQGFHLAVANPVILLEFATKDNPLMGIILADKELVPMEDLNPEIPFLKAQRLASPTLDFVLSRMGDLEVLLFMHVTLVFLHHMTRLACSLMETKFPWKSLSNLLNTLPVQYATSARIESDKFPLLSKDDIRPFPEDYAMRGLLWADGYCHEKFLESQDTDHEPKYLEIPSKTEIRIERTFWLALKLSTWGSSWPECGRTLETVTFPEHISTPHHPPSRHVSTRSTSACRLSRAMKDFYSTLSNMFGNCGLRLVMGFG